MKNLNISAGKYYVVEANVFLGKRIRLLFQTAGDADEILSFIPNFETETGTSLLKHEGIQDVSVKEILRYNLKSDLDSNNKYIDYLVHK
jgi:hypothetical protein